MINQEFEIIVDQDLTHGEIMTCSKIKWYNEKGYTCTSQSIYKDQVKEIWVISLLFEPTRAVLGV